MKIFIRKNQLKYIIRKLIWRRIKRIKKRSRSGCKNRAIVIKIEKK